MVDISAYVNRLYEWQCRKRLRNSNFTILCSNCIGGIIYHRLGLNFLSPTINMFIRQDDFIKFALNPKHYITQELDFLDNKSVNVDYPVGVLDDIKLWFNHSKTKEEALYDWDRRKRRIVWDNLYYILYDRDNLSRQQILSLQSVKCKRLIVLSERKDYTDIPYVKYIKKSRTHRENDQTFLDFDNMWMRTFEKKWDFVSWLNN